MPFGYGIDPLYFVFALPALLFAMWAQAKVKGAYSKWSQYANSRGLTGAEVARIILNSRGLNYIPIEATQGQLTDHYDPGKKVLRLSEGVYGTASISAMGIAAHECGHAIQDAQHYTPMQIRAGLVPVVGLGANIAPFVFLVGLLLNFPALVWIAVIGFSAAVLFSLVTLPVEWDASNRAKAALPQLGLSNQQERSAVDDVLNSAAWTYVAGTLQAVAQLLYFVFVALGVTRRQSNE
jgi:Zn-dependent membrane protease YugP